MDKKERVGNWLVEGIVLSLLFGIGGLISGQHLPRVIEGLYVVVCLVVIAWVAYKYIRLRRKQKQA